MTPILKPKNAGEVRYNTAHRRTRCVIERCFGINAKAMFSMPAFRDCALPWPIPSSLLWPLLCCIISPLYTESKTLMKTLKMQMYHLTLLLQQTQVAMPSASSFHDTLLNKINDLIKLHVRLIDNKIRKHMKTFTAIILNNPLILLF